MQSLPISIQDFAAACCAGTPLVFYYSTRGTIVELTDTEGGFSPPASGEILFAFIRLDKFTGRLLIHFLSHTLSGTCAKAVFANGYFFLRKSCPLSPEASSKLGLSPEATSLQAGQYPVLAHQEFYTISVPLAPASVPIYPPQGKRYEPAELLTK